MIKKKIYNLLQPGEQESRAEKIVDCFILLLIIINAGIIIADTFSLPKATKAVFGKIETITVVIFTIEYLLRLWTAEYLYPKLPKGKAYIKYLFSIMAIVDLFAILPFYLPYVFPVNLMVLRVLRVVRLLRIFKVNRYTHSLETIANVFKRKASYLISAIFVLGILMVVSSVLMYSLENPVQPHVFKNAFSGLWWSVVTFTTVGYGDIYPITAAGKVLGAIISVLGIGLVAVPTGIIAAGFTEEMECQNKEEKKYCPYCGKKVD